MSERESDTNSNEAGIPLWVALVAALAVLLVVRIYPFGSVFRGDVVLISNDPWVFRYLVDQALTEGAISRANPAVNWRAEPLLIWTLAFFSALLGGVERTGLVLAWYPVVTALISGLLVFVLARTLTDDVRIGLTAVVILAVTPLHVSRTALGFSDHHAFDYMWLLLTATALTWLVVRTDADRRRRWAVGAGLGLAVAGQTLAWRASPLMLVPTAGAVGAAAVILVRKEVPVRTLTPVVAGFGLAAVLVQLVHRTLAWQNAVVAGTPVLLFVGALALLGLVAVIDRADRSWPTLLGAELAAVALLAAIVWLAVPGFVEQVLGRIDAFTTYIEQRQQSGIGETAPILSAFGPIAGPIILLGFSPFLGLPAVAWGLLRGWREREPAWLVLAVYVVWFLALAFVQRRWAVQLGLFLSVFAGVGFVALANWLALVLPPMPVRENPSDNQHTLEPPDRTRLALLGGMGAVGVGSGALFSKFILDQLSYGDAAYGAAVWMREYASERGWTYPANYVFAEWGRVRMYNYLVNGQSRTYWYAQNNYADFIFDSDADGWYEELADRAGFVLTRGEITASSFAVQSQLHDRYGSAGAGSDGVGHFRAMWESADGAERVFTVVPGATVTGEGPAERTLVLSTTVTLAGTGRTIEYRRRVETDAEGQFSVVLAHPGEYAVAETDRTVTVTEADVREGTELSLSV
ncbi:MAG: STT3 domain-containing protein [Halovenus sp.]